jgi:hypothetical protein
MNEKFYLFGSKNSLDNDILIDVKTIPPNTDAAHQIVKYYNEKLALIFKDKKINANLFTIENNTIINSFKGLPDEINNSLFYTYDLHKQFYENPIKTIVERDLNEKILRVARAILSFYTRTHLRSLIKLALKDNLKIKIDVLRKFDFSEFQEQYYKKESIIDIKKVTAFQFGQIFSLIDDFEKDSYTKNGIIKNYPDLAIFLNRNQTSPDETKILNNYLKRFIDYVDLNINDLRMYETIRR